jgi:hypothetical protein
MHGTLHSAQPANLSTASASLYRPPAPIPQPKALGLLQLISTLKRNPLECWTREHFEKPVVVGGLPFKHVLLVHATACSAPRTSNGAPSAAFWRRSSRARPSWISRRR